MGFLIFIICLFFGKDRIKRFFKGRIQYYSMPLRGALREKIEERIREPEEERRKPSMKKGELGEPRGEKKRPRVVDGQKRLFGRESKLDWLLDILTVVFIVGVIANSSISIQNVFQRLPDFAAMQSYLLFTILFQLIKIGRKI